MSAHSATLKVMDAHFNAFHGDGSLHTCDGVVSKTVAHILVQVNTLPIFEDVAATFAKVKLIFRLRRMRQLYAQAKMEEKERKKLKKYK